MKTYRIVFIANRINSVAIAYTNNRLKIYSDTYTYMSNGQIFYSLVKAKSVAEAEVKGKGILQNFLREPIDN